MGKRRAEEEPPAAAAAEEQNDDDELEAGSEEGSGSDGSSGSSSSSEGSEGSSSSGPDVSDDEEGGESSQGEEDEEYKEINVDFEFFDPKEGDFLGLKALLLTYLDGRQFDCSGLVDTILQQVRPPLAAAERPAGQGPSLAAAGAGLQQRPPAAGRRPGPARQALPVVPGPAS
jgi:hypothetical protein